MNNLIDTDKYANQLQQILQDVKTDEEREVIEGILYAITHYKIDALSLYDRINTVMRYSNSNKRNAYTLALLPLEQLLSK